MRKQSITAVRAFSCLFVASSGFTEVQCRGKQVILAFKGNGAVSAGASSSELLIKHGSPDSARVHFYLFIASYLLPVACFAKYIVAARK